MNTTDNVSQFKFMRGLAAALAQRGASADGIAWLLGALDPAHADKVVDVPTHDARPTAHPQFVQERTISRNDGGTDPFDVCIITFGGDNTHCIYAVGKQGIDFATAPVGGGIISVNHFVTTEPSAGSTNLALIAGSGPNPLSSGATLPARNITMGRSVSRSLTIDYTGPTLEDGGSVVVAHYPNRGGDPQPPVVSSVSSNIVAAYAPYLSLREENFPTTNSLFYAGAARDGVYLPERVGTDSYAQVLIPSGLTIPFIGQGVYLAPSNPVGAQFLPVDAGSGAVPPWIYDVHPTGDSFIDSTAVTVTIFRSLNASASLLVKGCLSIATVPTPNSTERPYVCSAAVEDPVVIEAYARMLGDLPGAWPAKYNFLGALGGILASLGRMVLPMLLPAARQAGAAMITTAATEATRRLLPPSPPAENDRVRPATAPLQVTKRKVPPTMAAVRAPSRPQPAKKPGAKAQKKAPAALQVKRR
jgi:hypothetical protein